MVIVVGVLERGAYRKVTLRKIEVDVVQHDDFVTHTKTKSKSLRPSLFTLRYFHTLFPAIDWRNSVMFVPPLNLGGGTPRSCASACVICAPDEQKLASQSNES